ncbi:redoxin domain-containing protein [Halegenticoccus soli]|uniref:redoxin domain-containing protein n=1 Tax=Halegenticoccus soli TaxID=1985678 RepID=UPI000C6CCBA2|nr:redoxin domain-containing protein [Halegenticoccus soli]
MVDVEDDAPDFTVPLADGDVGSFSLSERLDEAPIVLAFFPAAFTSTCTTEMCTFRDRLADFEEIDAAVYGVSVDLPFALNEFRRQHDLSFPLLSDCDREVVDRYDVRMDFESLGVRDVAKRAVFVVDGDGEIAYRWVADDPGQEPDYEAVSEAAEAAA